MAIPYTQHNLSRMEITYVPRSLLKRETLIRNLRRVAEEIPKLDLPATIEAIYAFGGILREKERLHDIDLVILISMTPEQEARWQKFCSNFSTIDRDDRDRYPLWELRKNFEPYRKREILLREAVKDEKLAKVLLDKHIVPAWAGCFSWTSIYYPSVGIFFPSIEIVIRKLLIGRRIRGLQVIIRKYEDFVKGKTLMVAKNFKLAWSPEKPNIEKNLEFRTLKQKKKYLVSELDHFLNEEIPRDREEYVEARNDVVQANVKANVKINIDALDEQHAKIQRVGNEPYDELLGKCEQARIEMAKYREETTVLSLLAQKLDRWLEIKNESFVAEHTAESYIAYEIIRDITKREVKEERVRNVLRVLKLPEDRVITIRRYGSGTEHVLSESREEREALLRQAELEKVRAKWLRAIVRVVRHIDRRAYVRLEMTDEAKPKRLAITVYREVDEQDEAEKKIIADEFKAKGFEVKEWSWQIRGIKQVDLKGTETVKELQTAAEQMMLGDQKTQPKKRMRNQKSKRK